MNLLHEPQEIAAAKVGVLAYMAVEDMPVGRPAILRLQRQVVAVAKQLSIPVGYVELALYALLPPRTKPELTALIQAEQRKLDARDRRRLGGSIISTRTDVANRQASLHKIKLLTAELEQAERSPARISYTR